MELVLQALAAPRRVEILRLLRRCERSAGEIHRALGDVTFGAVSQHLGVLEQAGLVSARRDGRSRYYTTRNEGLQPLREWLDEMWADALGRLKEQAEAEERGERPERAPGEGRRQRAAACSRSQAEEKNAMTGLDFVLDRSVTIVARRETVFRYFTDSERFAAWWGQGSRIDPRPGGAVHIRFPNAIVAGGEVVEIVPPQKVVFSYGFESGQPIPIGASRVTITLAETPRGTLVKLHHELPSAEVRDEHVQGWRYQLARVRQRRGQGGARGRGRARRPLLRLLGRDRHRRSVEPSSPRSRPRTWPSAIPTPARPGSTT